MTMALSSPLMRANGSESGRATGSTRASRESVKKSSGVLKTSLKRLRTSQHMQIVDDGAAAEIEEILACATITRPPSLPPANMGQRMLNRHSFSKLSASLWSLLMLSQFNEQ